LYGSALVTSFALKKRAALPAESLKQLASKAITMPENSSATRY
jgi:hypothetical protein